MVRVQYDSRILCDASFMEWLLRHPKKPNIMRQLMYVKSTSQDCRGENNVILDFDFKEVLAKKLTEEHFLRAAVKEVTMPDALDGSSDNITKRIRFAIWLSNKPPCSTYIFTAPENKSVYENNPHLKGMRSVRVKAGEEALEPLGNFWRKFSFERELCH